MLPPRRFTCEYIRTFSTSARGSYMSSAFLIKLRVLYYRAATLLRRWSTIDFFLKKGTFFIFLKIATFWYIFQKKYVVGSLFCKVAV